LQSSADIYAEGYLNWADCFSGNYEKPFGVYLIDWTRIRKITTETMFAKEWFNINPNVSMLLSDSIGNLEEKRNLKSR